MKQRRVESTEKTLYKLGWISIGIMSLGVLLIKLFPAFFEKIMIPCVFHAVTGYYCPGCGGTRAVKYFLTGHWIKSFIYHPLIPYLGIGGGIFMITHTLSYLTKGRVKGIRFRNVYVYMMGIIIVVEFLVKNLLVYFYNYHII